VLQRGEADTLSAVLATAAGGEVDTPTNGELDLTLLLARQVAAPEETAIVYVAEVGMGGLFGFEGTQLDSVVCVSVTTTDGSIDELVLLAPCVIRGGVVSFCVTFGITATASAFKLLAQPSG